MVSITVVIESTKKLSIEKRDY